MFVQACSVRLALEAEVKGEDLDESVKVEMSLFYDFIKSVGIEGNSVMPGLYVTASAMYACAIPWVEASCTVLLSNAEKHCLSTDLRLLGSIPGMAGKCIIDEMGFPFHIDELMAEIWVFLTNTVLKYIGTSSSPALYARPRSFLPQCELKLAHVSTCILA
ncbi:unnamed protein product [Timema podura]|uniref:Uncharacterized protein n=1 Tax=Timema podura TaxID=61482 RepID=A0ABN7NLE2_TIMPD|nr:unnamed protein product [Timema podura]